MNELIERTQKLIDKLAHNGGVMDAEVATICQLLLDALKEVDEKCQAILDKAA